MKYTQDLKLELQDHKNSQLMEKYTDSQKKKIIMHRRLLQYLGKDHYNPFFFIKIFHVQTSAGDNFMIFIDYRLHVIHTLND